MRSPASGYRRFGLLAVVVVFVVAALLVSVPVPARAQSPGPSGALQPLDGVQYTVTWNNVDVSTAGSPSSALSIDLTQSATLNYSWTAVPASAVTISDARLQMFYLGIAVSTRDQVLSPAVPGSGHIPLSWTPVSVSYLLEGVYKLTASFLAPNGTTMWSENFYVRGTAPLGFVAILPIVLLLLVVYEVYGLVRSGRYATAGRTTQVAPPPSPPPSAPSAPPESGAPTPPTPPAEAPGGPSPPAGGSS